MSAKSRVPAAGTLLAVYAPAIFFDGLLQKSALDLFFLCLALWLTSRLTTTATTTATKTATVPLWIGLGAAIGALVLTRENALVLAAAILVWIQVSPLVPKNAVAFYNLGTMLQSRGELDAAAESFRRTLKIRPDYALAWINLGAVLGSRGDTAAAIEHFETALRSDPGSALAHFNLGIAHQSLGDLRAAARHYREVIALDGDLDAARKALANLERLEKQRDGAP